MSRSNRVDLELLQAVEALARAAGRVILDIYAGDFAVEAKADASPVTAADAAAEALITPALLALRPDWPVVAEEAAALGHAPSPGQLQAARWWWLVDPLDGTREFVSRNGEFTVNIALIDGCNPVLGVVYVPVSDLLYAGLAGQGAWAERAGAGRQPLRVRAAAAPGAVLACSRSHGDEPALQAWIAATRTVLAERIAVGSSLKFGLIAAGRADVYPRLGRTMEWDTAAGHAVLAAAGGGVFDLQGQPLRYAKPGFENPHFVARGSA